MVLSDPGAHCDVPVLEYSYSFDSELQKDYASKWTGTMAAQPEIEAYANHVKDRFELGKDIDFDTKVIGCQFDDATKRWTINAVEREMQKQYGNAAHRESKLPAGGENTKSYSAKFLVTVKQLHINIQSYERTLSLVLSYDWLCDFTRHDFTCIMTLPCIMTLLCIMTLHCIMTLP